MLDSVVLYVPYVYLNGLNAYVIVPVRVGQSASFSFEGNTISANISGTATANEIAYEAHKQVLPRATSTLAVSTIDPRNGKKHETRFEMENTDDSNVTDDVTGTKALYAPYIYLANKKNTPDYIPRMIMPVDGYRLERQEIRSVQDAVVFEIEIVEDNSLTQRILSDFDINQHAFTDNSKDGYFRVKVIANGALNPILETTGDDPDFVMSTAGADSI